jgi:hypothetical protein
MTIAHGVYNVASPSLLDGQTVPVQTDSTGVLKTSITYGVIPGNSAAQLGKAEDAVAASGDTGVAVYGVSNDLNAATVSGATGDYTALATSSTGQLIIKEYSGPGGDWNSAAAAGGILNTTTAVTMKAAAAAGIRNYLTLLDLTWETLGAATELVVRDGAAGTVIYRTKIGTAAGSKTVQFLTPIRGTAATLMEVATLTASVTGAVYVNAQGYVGP